jgi:pimeloyl-ACP methyl ester carboxylesterase
MNNTPLLPGISAAMVDTPRLKTYLMSSGSAAGQPVIFIHGNIASNRFWEETMLALPAGYRALAPDLRGFGASETKPVDATRGLRDFSDDVRSLIETLNLAGGGQRVHLVGWSAGAGVAMQYTIDQPSAVASLVLIAPMSPYGFGGTKEEMGTPCWADYAGSGGGTANPEFVRRMAASDRSEETDVSPRKVMNNFFYKPPFRAAPEREEVFLSAVLQAKTGDENYPGNLTPSANWPGVAPHTHQAYN